MEGTALTARELAPGGLEPLSKASTGTPGLDDFAEGGLPRGRPKLVCGPAGCGKTPS